MKHLNITIIGLGLIGGSLGLAIRERSGKSITVIGCDRNPDTLRIAVERGAVDMVFPEPAEAVARADIIFLCTPVLQIVPLVKSVLPYAKPDVIFTDVGSTKEFLQKEIAAILPSGMQFIGGHPMAGREQSGITAADKNLFQDHWYILIPSAAASLAAVDTVAQIIRRTGAILTTMNESEHDRCAAVISHVPHVTAAALVNLLSSYPDEYNIRLAGGGFRDTTRIASSNADMWADICLTNSTAIQECLVHLREILNTAMDAINRGDRQALREFFLSAKRRRDSLINASLGPSSR
ncbi:MAG: prephenate dehydrogenase/arogenate dehydrogenase family protein [Veillonellales bacterium]